MNYSDSQRFFHREMPWNQENREIKWLVDGVRNSQDLYF